MDNYLREIHYDIYKKWIHYQLENLHDITIDTNGDTITLLSEKVEGSIGFHDGCLTELSLSDRRNGNVEFYLHFQMQTLKHATTLFREFLDSIINIEEKKTMNILLSCTSGLTTSFFAQELNEASKTLGKDYHFEAYAYSDLPSAYKNGTQYDMLLLAPQIGYQQARIQSMFHRIPVRTLSSQLFAKYDVSGTISFIEEELINKKEEKTAEILTMKHSINDPHKILVIGLLKSRIHTHYVYRVYQNEDVLLNDEVIKKDMDIHDFVTIIRTVRAIHPDVLMVGISMPGIIHKGKLTFKDYENLDLMKYLKSRFSDIQFILENDVNAIATGIYGVQDDYDTLSFVLLPKGYTISGIGSVYKGQLIKGAKNIAGEIRFLPFKYSNDPQELMYSEEGSRELISKHILSIITILNPPMIAYYCSNIPDTKELEEELLKYIDKDYMPVIKKIDNMKEYIIYGTMILSIMKNLS